MNIITGLKWHPKISHSSKHTVWSSLPFELLQRYVPFIVVFSSLNEDAFEWLPNLHYSHRNDKNENLKLKS